MRPWVLVAVSAREWPACGEHPKLLLHYRPQPQYLWTKGVQCAAMRLPARVYREFASLQLHIIMGLKPTIPATPEPDHFKDIKICFSPIYFILAFIVFIQSLTQESVSCSTPST